MLLPTAVLENQLEFQVLKRALFLSNVSEELLTFLFKKL